MKLVKDTKVNSVWVAVENRSGREFTRFTLDYGTGRKEVFQFGDGYTYGEWARAKGHQPLTLSWMEGAERKTVDPRAALSPDLIGGRVLLTLKPEGEVAVLVEPRTHAPDLGDHLDTHATWLGGLALLLAVPVAVAGLRKAKAAASSAAAKTKEFFSNPARDGLVAALGLKWTECPVRMYTLDPDRPFHWHQGVLDGRMVGVHDGGRLWVGAPDTAAIVAFQRGPDGTFSGRDFTENDANPLLADAALTAELAKFSPAMRAVGILGVAVEGTFDWKKASAESLIADAKVLSAIRSRVESYDTPLVRAVVAGDEAKLKALLAGGADLEAETIGYQTPVLAAVALGRADLLRLLLAAGAKAQPPRGWPLFEAAARGQLDAVKALVEAGADPGQLGGWGGTAIHEAASNGHAAVVAYLLEKGCDPKVVNKDGATALGYAKYGKHREVIALLERAGG
jgi:uncharacterized protein